MMLTAKLSLYVPEAEPPPEPPPAVEVVDDLSYGILRLQRIENGLTLADKWTPAVVKINDRPVVQDEAHKGQQIPVHEATWRYIAAINDDAGYRYARSVGKMWINSKYEAGETPRAESISAMGNFVSWPKGREQNGCAGLSCFQSNEDWSQHDPAVVNWHTRPDLFWKATAVKLEADALINVGLDIDCFIPLMARAKTEPNGTGELWLALSEIEQFPALPVDVMVRADGVRVRSDPGTEAEVLEHYAVDTTVTLLEYRLLGASVWGRTKDGWIALLYAPRDGVRAFYTSWRLETLGVVPV